VAKNFFLLKKSKNCIFAFRMTLSVPLDRARQELQNKYLNDHFSNLLLFFFKVKFAFRMTFLVPFEKLRGFSAKKIELATDSGRARLPLQGHIGYLCDKEFFFIEKIEKSHFCAQVDFLGAVG